VFGLYGKADEIVCLRKLRICFGFQADIFHDDEIPVKNKSRPDLASGDFQPKPYHN
jgi:hypothetical protein